MMHYSFSINHRELKHLVHHLKSEGVSAYTRKAIVEYLETQDQAPVGRGKTITTYVDDELAEVISRVAHRIGTQPTTLVKEAFQWKLGQQTAADNQATPR